MKNGNILIIGGYGEVGGKLQNYCCKAIPTEYGLPEEI